MKKITIAIDGHSSCGKSTMAKDLARRIGYVYIDTGAMYRAVTLFAMRHNLIANGQVDAAKLQEEMGKEKGVVMDGRDIGTVVFPHAELKIFVTASAEVRAQRRYDELTAKGEKCNYEEILENVKERDHIDSTRETSPLRQAEDAIVLDNTHMTIPEQENWLMEEYKKRTEEE